jgi:hypothetical protein
MPFDEFSDISKPEYYNKKINIRCAISGKDNVPYYVPDQIKIKCATQSCECKYKEEVTVALKADNPDILMYVDAPSTRILDLVRRTFRISCKKFYCVIATMQTVERIFIGQIPGEGKKASHILMTAYYIGHGIDVNCSYVMKGYSTNDPLTQKATPVLTGCEKLKTSIDTFNLTKVFSQLQQFEIPKPTAEKILCDYLPKLYDTYARNITRVYHRFDLHLAMDLVFHSVLSFKVGDDVVKKGWLDVIIIGDTGQAKTPVAHGLSEYYGVGEFVNAENCTYAGLIAGLQQFNNKNWAITWGRLPLNDRGLVIIDEAANLGDDWTKLSRVRSEGIAEVTKIQHASTDCKVRLISLCNPIGNTIANYPYGIESLLGIFKAPEDIKRFDYALVVAHNEVKIADINRDVSPTTPMFSKTLEQQLILWAWSRKEDEVVFTDEAKKQIYSAAISFGNLYDFSIPLIQGENIRTKIARIAVAFAARLFSNRDKGRLLLVDTCHIECACVFLNLIYKKEASGYYQRSQLKKLEDIGEHWKENVDEYMKSYRNSESICKYFLQTYSFTSRDLEEVMSIARPMANEVISKLVHNNCLQKRNQYYIKTHNFTEYLKDKLFKKGRVIGD